MSRFQKVGYFGGTFDPPHVGHEVLAREAFCQIGLDAVMWLITPDPPHKLDREITPVQARLDMLELVTSRRDGFFISEVDLQRAPPYYAADTVEIIKRQQPEVDLIYIIGEDSLQDLPNWYEPSRFLSAIDQLAVAPRPGINSNLEILCEKLPLLKNKTVFLSEIMVEISSSLIRKRIKEGGHYDHFLNQEVADYIKRNRLYQADQF
jgi:nicotinate-nucleotide adenylyltransferase